MGGASSSVVSIRAESLAGHHAFQAAAERREGDGRLSRVASLLQERQGPILFQMPPTFKKDVSRLEAFLKHIAGRAKVAFEFRHASWLDDEVFDCLRAHSAVLCVADGDDLPPTDLVRTADWGYVRLRDDNYTDERLREWIKRIRAHKWDETYVFLMHEDTGIGPKLAARFVELAGA